MSLCDRTDTSERRFISELELGLAKSSSLMRTKHFQGLNLMQLLRL